jgi:2,3,4,5-tetrahydropyridine-2-carboxylate N-succinyltransferase
VPFDEAKLRSLIEETWQQRLEGAGQLHSEQHAAVEQAIEGLDSGEWRVATKVGDEWQVNEWLKKAVLLSLATTESRALTGGPGGATWWDKISSKFEGWDETRFAESGVRAVPGSLVRRGAYVGRGAILMPSFVNIGAYVGPGTMVDTWSTVGSCAHIGANCHLSGGVGIGGVLEPLQARPTIIEDDCFIGARSEVAEGVVVGQGAVLSMGVFLSASTKVVDRSTGQVSYGYVPPYSVVVPGSLANDTTTNDGQGISIACAVIVKQVTAETRRKTAINDLLRD